ncbi:EpsG family protein [Methylotenera sp.]|uniref:EpsG family protein n=1 Tax=Methylotenera sp. TaxID=2051956 RepID=UPI002731A125|nr:EpsG family protein [Methylotenera sp.]MDP2071934.1 EpsG family protein [Methylotenera sp.]MDP3005559.1 EpsG family protein [Methylotenera sp.]
MYEAVICRTVVKKQNMMEYALAMIGAIIAVYICQPISKDADSYLEIFEHISDHTEIEYLFRYWLKIGSALDASFSFTLLPLIFLTLLLKLKAFQRLGAHSLVYVFLTYIAVFYLLHESAQLRISCALAFALWSCVAIMRHRWAYAILLCVLAIGFHVTSVLLPLVFAACYYSKAICKFSWFFLLLGFLFFSLKLSTIGLVVVPVINLFGGRYTYYVNSFIEEQNTSGLFLVYALLLGALLIFLYFWGRVNSKRLPEIYWVLLSACVYGCSLLFLLYETVAVASRLSDVLVILIVPLLAIVISKLSVTFRHFGFILLGGFFSARIYQLFVL